MEEILWEAYEGMENKDFLYIDERDRFEDYISREGFSLIAWKGEEACAMAVFRFPREDNLGKLLAMDAPWEARVLHVEYVAVRPAWQGHGLHRKMVQAGEILGRGMGRDVFMTTVAPGNRYSLKNFQALEYEEVLTKLMYENTRRSVLLKKEKHTALFFEPHRVLEINLKVFQEGERPSEVRSWEEEDEKALTLLYFDAYRDTPGQQEEDLTGAERYLRSLREGDYGEFLSDASFVWEEEGCLRGACLMTYYLKKGLVADIFVEKSAQRRGIASELLRASLGRMKKRKRWKVQLSVLRENPALRLYKNMGFRDRE